MQDLQESDEDGMKLGPSGSDDEDSVVIDSGAAEPASLQQPSLSWPAADRSAQVRIHAGSYLCTPFPLLVQLLVRLAASACRALQQRS